MVMAGERRRSSVPAARPALKAPSPSGRLQAPVPVARWRPTVESVVAASPPPGGLLPAVQSSGEVGDDGLPPLPAFKKMICLPQEIMKARSATFEKRGKRTSSSGDDVLRLDGEAVGQVALRKAANVEPGTPPLQARLTLLQTALLTSCA